MHDTVKYLQLAARNRTNIIQPKQICLLYLAFRTLSVYAEFTRMGKKFISVGEIKEKIVLFPSSL